MKNCLGTCITALVIIVVMSISGITSATIDIKGDDAGITSMDANLTHQSDLLGERHFVLISKKESTTQMIRQISSNGTPIMVTQNTYEYDNLFSTSSEDVQIVWNYDGFISALVTDKGLDKLRNKGEKIRLLDEVFLIGRGGHYFDYRNGSPYIDPLLRLEPSGKGEFPYILAFKGPIMKSWLDHIQSMSAKILNLITRFSYLVLLRPELISQIQTLPYVGWIEPYHYQFRFPSVMDSIIFDQSQKSEINVSVRVITPLYLSNYESKPLIEEFTKVINLYQKDESTIIIHGQLQISGLISLIKRPDIEWIEPLTTNVGLLNDQATWVLQSNIQNTRSIYDHGITGSGQLLAIVDTGLDLNHEMFFDSDHPNFQYNCVSNPNHRKVYAYCQAPGTSGESSDYQSDFNGHGTHVSGSAAGDAPYNPPGPPPPEEGYGIWNKFDGNAIGAHLVIQDFEDDLGLIELPDENQLLNQAYNLGVKIHSNSWGEQTVTGQWILNTYDERAQIIDQFIWEHRDLLVIHSAGNCGPEQGGAEPCRNPEPSQPGYWTINSIANAKNIVTAGASGNNPNQENVATWGSRGPSVDGRIKPTLMAPGISIMSAKANALPEENQYTYHSGTSMSAPAVSGNAALVRQYFMNGWYPTGVPNIQNGFTPSAALVKATMIASAVEMFGDDSHDNPLNTFPNYDQGWGRILLDNALYFAGDKTSMFIVDETQGLTTPGDKEDYAIEISDSSTPFKVALVWTDPPGPLMCDATNPCLVNDLNLEVISPSGINYLGNIFQQNPWRSKPNPVNDPDDLNVEEVIYIPTPETGTWRIRIMADTVNPEPQPFALVVTSSLSKERRLTYDGVDYSKEKVTVTKDTLGNTYLAWLETNALLDNEIWFAKIDAQGHEVYNYMVTDNSDDIVGTDKFGSIIAYAEGTEVDSLWIFFANPCENSAAIRYCVRAKWSTDYGASWISYDMPGYVYYSDALPDPYPIVDRADPIHVDIIDSQGVILLIWSFVEDNGFIRTEGIQYMSLYETAWSNPEIVYEEYNPSLGGGHTNYIKWPKIAEGMNRVHVTFSYDPEPWKSYGKICTIQYTGGGGLIWDSPVPIFWTIDEVRQSTLDADEGSSYVHVAMNDFSLTENVWYIGYRRNQNNGLPPWEPINYIGGIGPQDRLDPVLLQDTLGNLHIAYIDDSFGNREAVYSISLDQGEHWNEFTRVTDAAGNALTPSLATNYRHEVAYAWVDDRDANNEIYFTRLYPEDRITHQTTHSINPSTATDLIGNTHIVWVDDKGGDSDIYYARFDAYGRQTALKDLTSSIESPTLNDQFGPVIVATNNALFIFFASETTHNSNYLIYHIQGKRSLDSGDNWIDFPGPDPGIYSSNWPLIPLFDRANPIDADVDSDGHIHLMWLFVQKYAMTSEVVYHAEYTGVWSSPHPIFSDSYTGQMQGHLNRVRWPKIAKGSDSSNSYVHGIFSYDPDVFGGSVAYIKYANSANHGVFWAIQPNIDETYVGARENALVADKQRGGVYVSWHDWTARGFDIFFKRSLDDGFLWFPEEAITQSNSWSRWPALSLDINGYLHLVYTDDTSGNDDLLLLTSTDVFNPTMSWNLPIILTIPIAGINGSRRTPDATNYPNGPIAIVWFDNWGSSSDWYEIYWMKVY